MKKTLFIIGIVVAVLLAAGYLFRGQLIMALVGSQIAPEHAFDEALAPAAPDYSQAQYWAALPSIEDPSDQRPNGVERQSTGTAVFFVHPTSYFGKHNWNQPLDDADANWIVDERVLRHQASIFNSCCEVYAPRYRQATFYSFLDRDGSGKQALAFAYNDVLAAFEAFLTRLTPEQPFILAGHSQGTRHATQLLRERIAGSPLQQRMVAAYLVGFDIRHDELGGVPACASATQTGCAVGWNAVDGRNSGIYGGRQNLLCTNPLNWTADGSYAAHELNRGAIGYPTFGLANENEDVTKMVVEAGAADAQCVAGQLLIPELRTQSFPSRMSGSSMHVYDYSLFHMNVRANARQRVSAYLTASG